jgi:hypothetical protein
MDLYERRPSALRECTDARLPRGRSEVPRPQVSADIRRPFTSTALTLVILPALCSMLPGHIVKKEDAAEWVS